MSSMIKVMQSFPVQFIVLVAIFKALNCLGLSCSETNLYYTEGTSLSGVNLPRADG